MIVKARPLDSATEIANEVGANLQLTPLEVAESRRIISGMQLARRDVAQQLTRILADGVRDQGIVSG